MQTNQVRGSLSRIAAIYYLKCLVFNQKVLIYTQEKIKQTGKSFFEEIQMIRLLRSYCKDVYRTK
jgi:hypothetical protein